MEISTEIVPLKNTRKHVVQGAIDLDQLTTYLGGIYSASTSAASMHSLWDLRDADFNSVSAEVVQSVMEFVSARWGVEGGYKAALVVSADLDYGLSRMYQMLMDGASASTVEIFKDINLAEQWIDG